VSYQPQEVLLDGRLTRASDVYSFAMIMLEIFTGKPVFEGYTSSQVSTHLHHPLCLPWAGVPSPSGFAAPHIR
jgi:serine/threonine protein kinase